MSFVQPHKVLLFFSFLFFSAFSYSQNKIVIKANIDKSNILIGERIKLNLEADFPLHEPMRFFSIDSIPHFEILERKKMDTVDNNEGIKLSQSLTLTSFDSGHWVIPSFELSGDRPMFTDSLPVNVAFSPFDPNQDYHDIKDIINVQVEKKKEQNWYWYAAASAVLVAAIVYLLIKKKKKPAAVPPPIDPYQEARTELEKLKNEKLPSKLFYTRLVDIFRLYIFRRKGIASLQKTTDDLVIQLKQLKLPENDFNLLAQSLRMSDFVKFAKYEAGEQDKENSLRITKHIIDIVETSERNTQASLKQ